MVVLPILGEDKRRDAEFLWGERGFTSKEALEGPQKPEKEEADGLA